MIKRPRRDFDDRLADAQKDKREFEQNEQIRQIRKSMRHWKPPTWDKIMMIVVFGVCVEIIIYSEITMWVRYDLSALYTLLSVPVAMFGTFWAYSEKAKAQNTAGGITYETAMKQLEIEKEKLASDNSAPEDSEDADPESGTVPDIGKDSE